MKKSSKKIFPHNAQKIKHLHRFSLTYKILFVSLHRKKL